MIFGTNGKNNSDSYDYNVVLNHQESCHDHDILEEEEEMKQLFTPDSQEELSNLISKGTDDDQNPSSKPIKRFFYMQISFLAIICVLLKFDFLEIAFFQQKPVNRPNINNQTGMNHTSMLNTILDSTITSSVPSSISIEESLATAEKSPLTEIGVKELFEVFPLPIDNDIIQIYNEETYNDLIDTLSTKNITIAVNGGSASAGGGSIKRENRYHSYFTKYLEELRNDTSFRINVADRSHGNRHSLHSAVFSQNFMPLHTDVLIWEFAINDFGYHHDSGSQEDRIQQERSMMIAWLQEVEKITPEPPKVILLYLWKAPFDINADNKIINPVFDSHSLRTLAKDFDFIVGHVNAAAYLDEQKTITFEEKKSLFLIDMHHPNNAGHLMISFLLLNLLKSPDKRIDSISHDHSNKSSTVEKYNWFCGNDTEDKRFVRDRIVQSDDSGWKSPLGTVTLEKPTNTWIRPGSKQLVFTSNEEQKILGKQDPVRGDRRGGVSIACCNHSSRTNYTSISITKKAEPMENVRAIFLGMGEGFSDMKEMKVYIDSNNEHVHGRLIRVPHSWPCFWNWRDIYDSWWFAFSEEQSMVSTIDFCVENEKCSENGESDALLISMAAYA
ncbi:hypothetical protein CTEN210_13053 [Chaetoceros tenuissimus]|uniref:Uncharacterized protein n=1 Tax=Chaetoceros tenuissimus TaxID=426638 RepID=A0AAD3D2A8_9STRA|nr:hypothetical protein CTEN210_13053 [Chaetoceros tenuissimus]